MEGRLAYSKFFLDKGEGGLANFFLTTSGGGGWNIRTCLTNSKLKQGLGKSLGDFLLVDMTNFDHTFCVHLPLRGRDL